jgi:hypothetical protein
MQSSVMLNEVVPSLTTGFKWIIRKADEGLVATSEKGQFELEGQLRDMAVSPRSTGLCEKARQATVNAWTEVDVTTPDGARQSTTAIHLPQHLSRLRDSMFLTDMTEP